jgi:hypothetical protein
VTRASDAFKLVDDLRVRLWHFGFDLAFPPGSIDGEWASVNEQIDGIERAMEHGEERQRMLLPLKQRRHVLELEMLPSPLFRRVLMRLLLRTTPGRASSAETKS